jgi:hypothetical protein
MKKILLSTIALTLFAISLLLFDISCKKTANAQSPTYVLPVATTSKLGGVIPDGTTISVDGTGKISAAPTTLAPQAGKIIYIKFGATALDSQLWTANYDGSGAQQINITLPANLTLDGDVKISPDHKTIFFTVFPTSGTAVNYIYACNIDGSNVHQVIGANVDMQVAY